MEHGISPDPTPAPQRSAPLDALRGLAMLWMTVFHFFFDLSHLGLWPQALLRDALWTVQRTAIVGLFLFCAGLSQALALGQRQRWPRFARRWAQIAGCALLVTAASWIMFPRSFIYFGVLHALALMLLLLRCSAACGPWLWPLGLLALLAPALAQPLLAGALAALAPLLDGRALNWIGLITRKPVTEDYVPLLPWFGVLCWGLASGQWLLRRRPGWLLHALPAWARPLALLGRWSLSYYMLHQPVLLGLLMAFAWVFRGQ